MSNFGPEHVLWPAPADAWVRPDWPAPANVLAFVTTRYGGVSQGRYDSLNSGLHVGDDALCVAENRVRILRQLPPGCRTQWLNQVHGTEVIDVPAGFGQPPVVTADAACVRGQNQAAVVMTADCLPVFFCDTTGQVAAVAHAGWRGLLDGVLEQTVRHLGVPGKDLLAWLGPAIAACHFEVGDEVRTAFLEHASATSLPGSREAIEDAFAAVSGNPGKWMMDIYALARLRLNAAQVSAVYGIPVCTVCHEQHFFSYRRDGVTGRMANVICIKPA